MLAIEHNIRVPDVIVPVYPGIYDLLLIPKVIHYCHSFVGEADSQSSQIAQRDGSSAGNGRPVAGSLERRIRFDHGLKAFLVFVLLLQWSRSIRSLYEPGIVQVIGFNF